MQIELQGWFPLTGASSAPFIGYAEEGALNRNVCCKMKAALTPSPLRLCGRAWPRENHVDEKSTYAANHDAPRR
jgi:hypothetical protein